MPEIGVMTQNFSIYYDLVKILKQRDISFISLRSKDPVPQDVRVIITTPSESEGIDFSPLIEVGDVPDMAVEAAFSILANGGRISNLVIGIDPGKRPGIAILGDGTLLRAVQVGSPEKVKDVVIRTISIYESKSIVIRIGHGAPTYRNRIINSIITLGNPMEMVDETSTSQGSETLQRCDDLEAARRIAMTKGYKIWSITISRDLALKVALGELSLKEAIDEQLGENQDPGTKN